eukprot:TRINITY_DN5105_c0_g1_i10.p2 TRINITY_DN5105_c0_g1~~TRINITY_DN5105_c0_g1_i10.p2  ORF type:complete len:165 (+),score=14.93 TRINITY_DN5105_c0_g1_i10:127-621(+)
MSRRVLCVVESVQQSAPPPFPRSGAGGAARQSAPPPIPRRAQLSSNQLRHLSPAAHTSQCGGHAHQAPRAGHAAPARHQLLRLPYARPDISPAALPPPRTAIRRNAEVAAGQVLRSEQALVNGCFPRDPDGTLIIAAPPKIFTRSDVLKMAGAAKRKAEAKAKL